ncbi:MAG: CCA tRNA nucleotidyltransferase, partial [Chloroflexi bacterium]|nr:CCA tRNA nucleotidyltransferase [Chloroflexota bacterium]
MTTDLTPYAGRWIALIGDQVTGVGFTAVEAEHAARHSRPKDRFTIRYVEAPGGKQLTLPDLLTGIQPLLAQETQPVYLVGGAVRDALLGRTSQDLDFVTPHDAIKLAFRMANALRVPAYVLDRERDVGRVVLSQAYTYLDFTRFRGPDLEADLYDRDFTINAIALPATAQTENSLIDPTGGQADLQQGIIRHVHKQTLLDDPVRTLRALRLAVSLDFKLA